MEQFDQPGANSANAIPGDVTITLPYAAALRRKLPGARLDFLTSEETAELPRQISDFDNVYAIGGGRNRRLQHVAAATHLPRLLFNRYDVVADLQNSPLSRRITKLLRPAAWSHFDHFSPLPAGVRTQRCLEELNIGSVSPNFNLQSIGSVRATDRLREAGHTADAPLVVLNPAGFFESRNWPLDNYVEFAGLWQQLYSTKTQFLLVGLNRMGEKANFLQQRLGSHCINLVGQTTAAEAFSLVGHASLVLSEDSGLMHMAWVSGMPTVALFGSSRSDWSRPLGEHSVCLDSSDLECGSCMLETCQFGDTRCLARGRAGYGASRIQSSLL